MPYWDSIGRALMAQVKQDDADRMVDYLNANGLDATVSSDPESDLYDVLVLREQEYDAVLLLEKYYEKEKERAARAASYQHTVLEQSPSFVPAEEKFRTSTNASSIYIASGAVICVMALMHFFLLVYRHETSQIETSIFELFLGFLFVMFGINTNQKVRMLKDRILEENAFNDQVIRWYTTTYPAEFMDRTIDAALESQEISEEERFARRRQLIQDYILREYDISDSAYLDYLTDLIYKKLYFPNVISAAM